MKQTFTAADVIAAIVTTTHTDKLAPGLFTHCFGRGVTAAAFRMAKARKLIELNYISVSGSPVYRLTAQAVALQNANGTVQ